MAAPASVDIHNLSGVFVMNKTLSDPSDPPLTLVSFARHHAPSKNPLTHMSR